MEFPDLGQHCFEPTCKQLDFLPVKCDGCSNVFCFEHMSYSSHTCPGAYKKDVQVPVCPLCSTPIPTKRGDPPDIAVGKHIDNNCESDTAKTRRKVFSNRCSSKGCKARELMPIKCSQCNQNFCLRHRHPTDHQCSASDNKALNAALARQEKSTSSRNWFGPFKQVAGSTSQSKVTQDAKLHGRPGNFTSVQGNMDEDEAMARALAASLQDSLPGASPTVMSAEQRAQEDEDFQLAKAIQESERTMNSSPHQNARDSPSKCEVS